MRFTPSFLEEIKARLPVSTVVRGRVKLQKVGREWKGLSPFNAEKTPSFFVNDQKMAWFDHSAGKNGNIFDFLMETEGLSFPEAVKRLAHEAGLALPQASPEAEAQEKARASLHEVLALASAYYTAELLSPRGHAARAYLDGRGLGPEVRNEFRLGYALPEKYALRDAMAAKGISPQALIDAGLLIHGEEIAVPYDRFRDRVLFPIEDSSGRVIAFGGRTMAKDVQPKYLNSPETTLFHKGAILYNHHRARKAAHGGTQVIAVEGYVDVIALVRAGFPATVAPLGTALTTEQCELLWHMSEEPILCFDGDRAGRKAAYRAIDLALPLLGPGRSFNFALLPEGEDPDELIRSSGPEAMQEVLNQALPLADLIWMRETQGKLFATPERRAGLERRLYETVQLIREDSLRRYYQAEFKDRLCRHFGPSRRHSFASRVDPRGSFADRLGKASFGEMRSHSGEQPLVSPTLAASSLFRPGRKNFPPREGLILLLLLNHPGLIGAHLEELAELLFISHETGSLRDLLLAHVSGASPTVALDGPGLEPASLRVVAEHAGFAATLQRLDILAAHGSHWYLKPDAAEADAEQVLIQALNLHRRAGALHKELQLAELALGKDSSEANLGRLKDIQAQLSALGGIEAAVEGFGVLSGRPGGSL
ncbi:MAG TPA: DNA primase [Methylocella sp.]|nr:DNA primase [Methylocella sp.]